MSWTQQFLVSVFEFLLSVVLAVFVVYLSYRGFARMNRKAYDAQKEIYAGNVAVALLMATLMYAAALVMRESIYPVMSIITVGITSGGEGGYSYGMLAVHCLGHLAFGFLLSVGCVHAALRAFSWLNRRIDENTQIKNGNTAVAVIMSSVVLVVALYVQSGVGALAKSLLPQPQLGGMEWVDEGADFDGDLPEEE
jgi:uncharacterized membrane protein YjfL (UPF0719 family)